MSASTPLPPLPEPGAPLCDAHAHLDMLEDPARALANAAVAGVALVATVVDLSEDERTFSELDAWLAGARELLDASGHDALAVPDVRIVVGAHPHNASLFTPAVASRMREATTLPRVSAFGELGLDFHYDHSPRDAQRTAFRQQLVIAREVGFPVIVHVREAHDEGLAILAEQGLPPAGCVIHCFTEDAAMAERFLELGCILSFAGPVTFKKAQGIREAAAITPLDRLLVETDAPFLAPEPLRGRKNEPAFTVLTAVAVADAKGIPTAEVASAALENARWLFRRG
ncbi:MAG: TatD family hydrolase [Actinomycetia bacterium]|nr:TatD family hydrolase [Actinomycetes bacterium]